MLAISEALYLRCSVKVKQSHCTEALKTLATPPGLEYSTSLNGVEVSFIAPPQLSPGLGLNQHTYTPWFQAGYHPKSTTFSHLTTPKAK